MRASPPRIARNLVLAIIVAAPDSFLHAQRQAQVSPKTVLLDAPQPIYSNDQHDPWNRIFYYLFSRRMDAHLTPEFPEGAPFRDIDGLLKSQRVSTRTFERQEIGDRPIDPLYPSFFSDAGARVVLSNPAYAGFWKAMQEALQDNAPRNDVARALMQNDLWSAYDILALSRYHNEKGENELAKRNQEVLELLGRLIRKIALTPEEIRSLPDNCPAATKEYSLPDLFGRDSGWVEVQWFPERLHDQAAGYRRVSRVFLKPAGPPRDMQEFLNDFRSRGNETAAVLDGAALVIQLLVIDTQGHMMPTTISTDVQIRLFEKTKDGVFQKTQIGVFELNRRRFLGQPQSSGLVAEAESEPAYLPSAGNDYTFASKQISNWGPPTPLVVKLRTRCAFCHGGGDLTNIMTFSMKVSPEEHLGPAVRQLNPAAHEAADFVMSQKANSDIWKTLHSYLASGTAQRTE
jgi:hypothetical protein